MTLSHDDNTINIVLVIIIIIVILGQLILPSLQGMLIEYRPNWPGLRLGVFTCVGRQVTVTLCDPIWQVTPCSC